ncbi:MAG: ATP-binding cassette domain-containing protein [Sphingopyxis terrae]|uniref:molybdenum ABC transporter ATP-binding protein n=1 Tax=Sphingopyxis terrae TaxID=33052 RepID=UPI001C2BACFC|nr:ATP-binding cassette domain-containing protein [Sphingopyxis terrae]MBU7589776.1 ATP-binding cassette domain-containing protein [Sphingopyxis terrae]QXF11113.1 ATP-binding cassette domain-containing protein [Sphingopyxis terrae subsp. terrae]
MAIDIAVEKSFGASVIAAQFTAEAGLTALFGPSGVGKTSLLNMVAGLLRPDRGHIRIGGRTLFDGATDLPPEARRVGYVFQDGRLFPHRRVKANLLYGWRLADPANRWMTLDEAADFLGIGHLLGRWPQSLSGGEAQRVAIGRALLAAPQILLMDEPLSSLDAARRDDIMTVIERIRDELKVPILYVSHDRAEVDRLATQIVEVGK